MKINELIGEFLIQVSNEENDVLESIEDVRPLSLFTDREKVVIENLIRKSLVSKIVRNGQTLVARNDQQKTNC